MGLVDYSDSENSDSDTAATPKPIATSAKPTFKKVVDRSNPRKILVSLPKFTGQDEPGEEQTTDGPPAKRPRVGGGGAFSGFNALLPAPKRTGQVSGGGTNGSAAGRSGLSKGVSLKTGPTPGFSREEVSEPFDGDEDSSHRNNINLKDDHDTPPIHQEAPPELTTAILPIDKPNAGPKRTGSAMMFKPLSVARKPQKKPPNTVASISTEPPPPLPKKKVSLFPLSATDQGNPIPPTTSSPSDYSPLIYQSTPPQDPQESLAPPQNNLDITQPQNDPTLDEIATSLNLSNSAKRQLFGRQGASASPITVINFNTDAEYAANEQLRAAGETVQHNPVRAIAPGKHSLKQLVSSASNQKEALEEHFATGKRNKKEAGSRYGW
ncbi:MAG: hypothetical protein M1813_005142 [Trichoglossum hirsutum]|nr:MAG: hypothetical protein M1813_005142 [Trichoglossum hirsutum]